MKKHKILIIDDSELNREILADMLEDFYEIEEAEDGEQGIRLLEEKGDTFSLVLLDLKMPVMDGYEVLKIMKQKQWLDVLPVICISSEASGESICLAYELGASDYFTRPFDAQAVLNRVRNTILLKEKVFSNLQDAMEMLSTIFFRILKVDLTDGTCIILKGANGEERKIADISFNLSDILDTILSCGYIHEEDWNGYQKFCSIENLRKKIKNGNDKLIFHYRSKIEQEFRWFSMEVIKSLEYTPEHQVVMLYVRDVNDEYLKQLNLAIRRTRDSVGTVTVNVSKGVCISGSSGLEILELQHKKERWESYVERISKKISQENIREDFKQKFSRENMLKCFLKDSNVIRSEFSAYYQGETDLRMYRATAEVIRSSVQDQVEAIVYITDITSSYISETIPHLLYRKNFDEIALIDSKKKCMGMNSPEAFDVKSYLERELDYDSYVERIAQKSIPEDERESFKRDTQLDKIKQELDKRGHYALTVHHMEPNGEKRLKSYTYLYLSKEFGVILAAVEDVTELSEQDVLTGGYNRQGFIHQVEKILENCEDVTKYAVMFFNIKNFKAVNELFGTNDGDMVLRGAYQLIQKSKLKPLVTARVEADHFTCFIERKNLDLDVLTQMCQYRLSRQGKTLHLYGRCGIYILEADDIQVDGMINRAKLAKKYITDEYVQVYKIYDASMQSAYMDEAKLSGDIKEGIDQEQFQIYYQPVVNSQTGEITAAEALVRWIHPKRGFVSPAIFIPALEQSGHISKLDLYVLKKVDEFQKKRYKEGKKIVPVSVNLSWMDFYDETLMKWLRNKCEDDSIPPNSYRVEITETSYAAIEENYNEDLECLRKAGILVLLDDFGSGYSSFGMLQNYNFDIMKIDMSFVRQIETNPKSRSIIRFIIALAHEMGLHLVAEGAETQAQVDFLKESGCDLIQGFYFYKPLPEGEFVKLLDEICE